MKLVFPLIALLGGSGAGIGAGFLLAPDSATDPDRAPTETPEPPPETQEGFEPDLIMLNNQFVIPVVEGERITSMVVLSIGLEVATGTDAVIYEREVKLRDLFLQVLFNHANMGGFSGAFTNTRNLDLLRKELLAAARKEFPQAVQGVLITDLARRDV